MFILRPDLLKNKAQVQEYKSGYLLPILTVNELLALSSQQHLIKRLRELVDLPTEYFDALYEKAIHHFAEFVQVLPSQMDGALSGLLNQGLARGFVALQQFIAEQESPDQLYNYAVFTAGLFADISKVIINQKMILTDEEGNFVDDWIPLEGSMLERAQYYKILQTAPIYLRLQHSITPLLVRQIMPEEGFLWIANDAVVFADWLDALRGDTSQGGKISRALALVKREDFLNLENSLEQIPVELVEPKATHDADIFFNWLKDGIANGDIKTNVQDANVFIVPEGVFIDRKIFLKFSEIYNLPIGTQAITMQFCKMLGLAKGMHDFVFDQYFMQGNVGREIKASTFGGSMGQRTVREGMVLDPSTVFVRSQIPANSNMLRAMQTRSAENHNLPNLSRQQQDFSFKK